MPWEIFLPTADSRLVIAEPALLTMHAAVYKGASVVNVYSPSLSVLARPKPVNVCPSRHREPDRATTFPSGSACQISTSASGTGSPAPSYTRPCSLIASARVCGTSSAPPAYGSA